MQCLYALPIFVQSYKDPKNDKWTKTIYNCKLKEFFKKYKEGFGILDPLPYFINALSDHDEQYNIFDGQAPFITLQRLISALIISQNGILEEEKKNLSETYLDKLITSKIFVKCKSYNKILFSHMQRV